MFAPFKFVLTLVTCCLLGQPLFAQTDSLVFRQDDVIAAGIPVSQKKDSLVKYNPRKAIMRSAILPGWGQVTNKKYWKLPLVYGALGTTTYLFFRNLNQYKEAKNAYILATDGDPSNDDQIKQPYFSVKDQPERIRTFRNQVRQNVDYSVLFFLIFWGLNVADAAVDAHLKSFDVSDNLSIRIKTGYSPLARTNGLSVMVPLGKK